MPWFMILGVAVFAATLSIISILFTRRARLYYQRAAADLDRAVANYAKATEALHTAVANIRLHHKQD